MNYWKGGMKKSLEEEIATTNSYASTAGICMGEFMTTSSF
jgi:hypothetical protein